MCGGALLSRRPCTGLEAPGGKNYRQMHATGQTDRHGASERSANQGGKRGRHRCDGCTRAIAGGWLLIPLNMIIITIKSADIQFFPANASLV